jgi:hypothetical protein
MTIKDQVDEWYRRLIESSPDAMKAYIATGLPLEFTSERTKGGGIRITATTKFPCALIGDTLHYRRV